MRMTAVKKFLQRLRRSFTRDPDSFLNEITGVIHVGANTGQERHKYARLNLDVIWIEPDPEVFARLESNLQSLTRQRAMKCLITDRDDQQHLLHVSNNAGLSSSILELKGHKDIWPEVAYTRTIPVTSTTLTSLLASQGIAVDSYQALVMDTQGSELLVLRGSIPLLGGFRYIKTEVPDFEAYANCCVLADMTAFMSEHGFAEISRRKFAQRAQGGAYYDVVYRNSALAR